MTDALQPLEDEEPTPPPLPEPVRTRVVALAAEAVGRMPTDELPPALKRVASFVPAKRARVAGPRIAGLLETDPSFRERLAVQVRSLTGELGAALDEGRAPSVADPVEVAAAAYLLRSPGWELTVLAAAAAASADRDAAEARAADERVERLQRQVATLQADVQQARARTKEQVERLKAENTDLRRRLNEERGRSRAQQAASEEERTTSAAGLDAAARSVAAAEAEVRRLRGRIAELEADLGVARRSERSSKVGESVRARLLVDTLVEAARGLQRELGLPALDRLPADTVLGAEEVEGGRTSSGHGSLPVSDPGLLEELLRMPRAHLVVDGYNVTKNAWPELSLELQRARLLTGVAALQARSGAEVTVVFDAAETQVRPPVVPPRGVRVRFSPFGVIADDVIRDIVAAEPPGRAVVVASSDQAVARDVLTAGFRVVANSALAAALGVGRG